MPNYIDPEAWEAFKDMRRAMGQKAPFTKRAEELTLRRLEDFHRQGYDVNHILETAVERGYRGVWITQDTPRRQLTQIEQQNAAKIIQMVRGIGK